MEKDIDKSVESLKIISEYIGENYFFSKDGIRNLKNNIKNVLLELEKLKESNKDLVSCAKGQSEKILELNTELETYKEEFKKINKALNLEEEIVEPYTVDIIEGLKGCVTQQKAELETYKKIAEKLAEEVDSLSNELQLTNEDLFFKYCDLFAEENKCDNECSKCIIDWARKEVEKNIT